MQAVEAELAEFVKQYVDQVLDNERATIVRNDYQPEREIQTGIGPITVKIPVCAKKEDAVLLVRRWCRLTPYVRKTSFIEYFCTNLCTPSGVACIAFNLEHGNLPS